MIKINELRNGILLHANGLHEGKLMTVSHFEYDYSLHADYKPIVFFAENKGAVGEYLKDCEGVLLTGDILLKIGFKSRNGSTERIKDYFIGTNPVTHDWLFSLVQIGDEPLFFKNSYHQIRYVHQLQNLYLALTGEDLNVQLSEPKVE